MVIEIDEGSGFCFGVTTAIRKAEEELAKGETLYCLGDIVHNGMECERLKKMGLITINHEQLAQLQDVKVLLRAHGEPPETYELASENNIEIIDATCPVVLQLQKRIKKKYDEAGPTLRQAQGPDSERVKPQGTVGEPVEPQGTVGEPVEPQGTVGELVEPQDTRTVGELVEPQNTGQIVIFGKKGHAEVLGLVGQTKSSAIVIESFEEVKKLDFKHDIYLYSQTTKSLDEFHRIIDYIQEHISPEAQFQCFDTICRSVANRMPNISQFATKHDLILFVCGKKSSNGKVLFNECLRVNANSHLIEDPEEIQPEWLEGIETIGICGATSTPKWLMEQCRDKILRI
jgi:4-hydroxy-3-methylbut-2-enyl diphosphate reductase